MGSNRPTFYIILTFADDGSGWFAHHHNAPDLMGVAIYDDVTRANDVAKDLVRSGLDEAVVMKAAARYYQQEPAMGFFD